VKVLKPKQRYSKKLVTGISIFLLLFIIAVLFIFWHTGTEPTALIASVFGAALGEYWALAGVKKAEIRMENLYKKKEDMSND